MKFINDLPTDSRGQAISVSRIGQSRILDSTTATKTYAPTKDEMHRFYAVNDVVLTTSGETEANSMQWPAGTIDYFAIKKGETLTVHSGRLQITECVL